MSFNGHLGLCHTTLQGPGDIAAVVMNMKLVIFTHILLAKAKDTAIPNCCNQLKTIPLQAQKENRKFDKMS
jgi:hypothetical protein